jgi:hypothetical protein
MKVYIGPYSRRWISAIHHRYMNKKYNHDWRDNHNKFEQSLEKVEYFLQGVYNATINKIIDKFPEQRINVRIHHYDVWSMDDTLAQIILPMLKLLKENKHGSPYVDNDDVPAELHYKPDPDNPHKEEHDDLIHKRWAWILDEMLWAFERKAENDYSYDDDYKARQKRMSNGFRLFGKYYEALWD